MEFLIRIIRYLCYYFPHNKVWMVQKEYFSKIPSELNSNDPFYPILIPNTSYVKFSLFFFLVVAITPPTIRCEWSRRKSLWKEDVVACPECGREMLGRNLERHSLIHRGIRQYSCLGTWFYLLPNVLYFRWVGSKFDLINHHFKLEFVDFGLYFIQDENTLYIHCYR